MKKIFAVLLTLALVLSLAACGKKSGGAGQAAPDLNQYFENFMSTLGDGNAPAMMDLEGQFLDAAYPGLGAYQTKQCVIKAAAISSVPYEFALVELENEADAKAVAEIFQARIDSQAAGGAFYPDTIAGWEKAEVITQGHVAALICASAEQDTAVNAFRALFQ